MLMKLSRSESVIAYSPRERKLFDLLKNIGATKRDVSSRDIAEAWYTVHANGVTPYHSREIINNVMRSLAAKMRANDEPIQLVKSPRAGPKHITYRIVRHVDEYARAQ